MKIELYDMESPELFEYMENVKLELKKNNNEYKELFKKIEKIKDKYPNVRAILEDEKVVKMSVEECKELLECVNLYRDLLKIEQNAIFFLGGRHCYNYLRKLSVL